MRKFFSRLSGVVWTAVLAVVYAMLNIVLAVAGAGIEVTTALAAAAITLAVLSPKQ
jgi:hypothetical protein